MLGRLGQKNAQGKDWLGSGRGGGYFCMCAQGGPLQSLQMELQYKMAENTWGIGVVSPILIKVISPQLDPGSNLNEILSL